MQGASCTDITPAKRVHHNNPQQLAGRARQYESDDSDSICIQQTEYESDTSQQSNGEHNETDDDTNQQHSIASSSQITSAGS